MHPDALRMILITPTDFQRESQGISRAYILRTLGTVKAPTTLRVKKANMPQPFSWDHQRIYSFNNSTEKVITPNEWRSIFEDQEEDFSDVQDKKKQKKIL